MVALFITCIWVYISKKKRMSKYLKSLSSLPKSNIYKKNNKDMVTKPLANNQVPVDTVEYSNNVYPQTNQFEFNENSSQEK